MCWGAAGEAPRPDPAPDELVSEDTSEEGDGYNQCSRGEEKSAKHLIMQGRSRAGMLQTSAEILGISIWRNDDMLSSLEISHHKDAAVEKAGKLVTGRENVVLSTREGQNMHGNHARKIDRKVCDMHQKMHGENMMPRANNNTQGILNGTPDSVPELVCDVDHHKRGEVAAVNGNSPRTKPDPNKMVPEGTGNRFDDASQCRSGTKPSDGRGPPPCAWAAASADNDRAGMVDRPESHHPQGKVNAAAVRKT